MAGILPPVLISEVEIQKRVADLAEQISKDYADVDELFLIGVLRGSFIFLADLSRRLTVPRRVDFIALSSYGDDATTTGAVRLIMDVRTDIEGKEVLIVEDIIDSGHTLNYLVEMLAVRRPASIKTCVLVRKDRHREVEVPVDYLGFEIPDVWVVGYGLDYADRHRMLPYIGVIEPPAEFECN